MGKLDFVDSDRIRRMVKKMVKGLELPKVPGGHAHRHKGMTSYFIKPRFTGDVIKGLGKLGFKLKIHLTGWTGPIFRSNNTALGLHISLPSKEDPFCSISSWTQRAFSVRP